MLELLPHYKLERERERDGGKKRTLKDFEAFEVFPEFSSSGYCELRFH